jgi:NitT/TauT family transport system substrate-binding protein
MSRYSRLLVAACSAILITACGNGQIGGDAEEFKGATIRLGDGPFLSSGGYIIASERGYFEEMAITIEYSNFTDGAMMVSPLAAGEIDIAAFTASAGTFNSRLQGSDFRIFVDRGQECPDEAYIAMVVSDELHSAGLESLSDFGMLSGQRIGVGAPGSINQYTTSRALEEAGLDPQNDVTWVEGVPQPELVGLLGTNQVDAINVAWELGLRAESEGFGRIVATGGEVEPCAQIATYVVRQALIDENREAVVRFTMAYLQGVSEFNAAQADPNAHDDVVTMLAENTFLENPELIVSMAPHWAHLEPDGTPNVDSIMEQQEFWINWGLVEGQVGAEEIIDLSIVEEARQRLNAENPFGG